MRGEFPWKELSSGVPVLNFRSISLPVSLSVSHSIAPDCQSPEGRTPVTIIISTPLTFRCDICICISLGLGPLGG